MKMGFTKIACRLTEPTYALSASQTLEGVCQRTILMQNSGTTQICRAFLARDVSRLQTPRFVDEVLRHAFSAVIA